MSHAENPPGSGTPDVEILEFVLAGRSFGVDVRRLRAIEQYDPARLDRGEPAHPPVIGHLRFRDDLLTMIDAAEALGARRPMDRRDPISASTDRDVDPGARLALVMEFDRSQTAFLVDGIGRVHRVARNAISRPKPGSDPFGDRVTGSLRIDGRGIPIVDLEKVVLGCELLETVGA